MTKFTRLKSVVAIAGACGALFASVPANAYVYAVSSLEINDLVIGLTNATTNLPINAATGYSFNVSDSANIIPSGGIAPPAAGGSNGCTSLAANCNVVSPVLSVGVANATGSNLLRADDNFSILGIVAGKNYSNSDAQINSAALVQGVPTSTKQIAESLLSNTNAQAIANTSVSSTTTLSYSFAIGTDKANLFIGFNADSDIIAEINDVLAGSYQTKAGVSVNLKLSKDQSGGQSFSWTPKGDAAACSGSITGAACAELSDPAGFTLNEDFGSGSNPDLVPGNNPVVAYDPQYYALNMTGLSAGRYTLLLTATTNTDITREAVPEPSSLALLGLALAGLGLTSRRRIRK